MNKLVDRTPANIQHWPNLTGFLFLKYCCKMAVEPTHLVGAVPPVKFSPQFPSTAPSSSGELTAAESAREIFTGSPRNAGLIFPIFSMSNSEHSSTFFSYWPSFQTEGWRRLYEPRQINVESSRMYSSLSELPKKAPLKSLRSTADSKCPHLKDTPDHRDTTR